MNASEGFSPSLNANCWISSGIGDDPHDGVGAVASVSASFIGLPLVIGARPRIGGNRESRSCSEEKTSRMI